MDSPSSLRPGFNFDNSYARELPGFFVEQSAARFPAPELQLLNEPLARKLGLNVDMLSGEAGAALFSGQQLPSDARPLAQAYAGHQFGGFSPQLGDGRALLVGEAIAPDGTRRDIQLKGSGLTPFSRGGDGKAAFGPVLREYLIGEAMSALGIPTTRALAVVTTGETVYREGMPPGAVLTRVAASHIRVGTFQFFAARRDTDSIRRLADYTIARHDPLLVGAEDKYLKFFDAVMDRQARLIAQWMHVGFIHGVMNTDNMTISGETIDYGPCAFMDAYDLNTVFSSIDTGGRYAYGQQPIIGQWNLARFAETLIGLFDEPEDAVRLLTQRLEAFPDLYAKHWQAGMWRKFGLSDSHESDLDLINGFLDLLHSQNVDFTLAFRRLSDAARSDAGPARSLFAMPDAFDTWLTNWRERVEADGVADEERAVVMDRVNPIYIPRNHKVEEALTAASEKDDMGPFERLLGVLERPFEERDELDDYAKPAPDEFAGYQTFCGT